MLLVIIIIKCSISCRIIRPCDFDEETRARLNLDNLAVNWPSTLDLVGDQDVAEALDGLSDDEVEIGEEDFDDTWGLWLVGRCLKNMINSTQGSII